MTLQLPEHSFYCAIKVQPNETQQLKRLIEKGSASFGATLILMPDDIPPNLFGLFCELRSDNRPPLLVVIDDSAGRLAGSAELRNVLDLAANRRYLGISIILLVRKHRSLPLSIFAKLSHLAVFKNGRFSVRRSD